MKEAKDLLKELLNTLNEVVEQIEDMDDFDLKSDVLIAIDSAYNEISYQLSSLSS